MNCPSSEWTILSSPSGIMGLSQAGFTYLLFSTLKMGPAGQLLLCVKLEPFLGNPWSESLPRRVLRVYNKGVWQVVLEHNTFMWGKRYVSFTPKY